MEERKIDKDAATELYLHIIHSEEVSGLKLHSSVVADTGGGANSYFQSIEENIKSIALSTADIVELMETAFLAENALDISAMKQVSQLNCILPAFLKHVTFNHHRLISIRGSRLPLPIKASMTLLMRYILTFEFY